MLINKQIPEDEYRHNYIRLAFVIGTLALFNVHIIVNQLSERGSTCKLTRSTFLFLSINLQVYFQIQHYVPRK
jgi:hypothetical protein